MKTKRDLFKTRRQNIKIVAHRGAPQAVALRVVGTPFALNHPLDPATTFDDSPGATFAITHLPTGLALPGNHGKSVCLEIVADLMKRLPPKTLRSKTEDKVVGACPKGTAAWLRCISDRRKFISWSKFKKEHLAKETA